MIIQEKFLALKKSGKMAFMPFIVAGDPSFKESLHIAKLLTAQADCLEIGFPYSDPLADGPIIQRANMRALASDMTINRVFEFIKKIRKFTNIPITVLVYANLICQRGVRRFYRQVAGAGTDAILVPDLPVEESEEFVLAARANQLDQIFLVSQTTTNQRLRRILRCASGYLYLVSILGTTGTRSSLPQATIELIRRVKRQTSLPLAVGFGISRPGQIRQLQRARAHGAIVGSAIIDLLARSPLKIREKQLLKYIDELRIS